MLLYFYCFIPKKGEVQMKTAEVTETEKTYKSATNECFPFMYKRKLLKTELRTVAGDYYSGFTCILDVADPAAAETLFCEYLNQRYARAEEQVKQWGSYLKSLEGAQWTEKP